MTPAEWEDAMSSLCLDRDGDSVASALPGDRSRWLLYREMVRHRIVRESGDALWRTRAALGADAWELLVAEALHARVTKSRYFRQMPLAIAEFARVRPEVDRHALAVDVAAIEVRDSEDVDEVAASTATLDGTTAPTSTSRVIGTADRASLVWRDLRTLRVGVLDVAPWFAQWFERWRQKPHEAQPALVAAVEGLAEPDVVARIETWSALVARLVESGAIVQIGSRESN